jgi:hypothetical protein
VSEFIKAAKEIMQFHGSFQGWIFEFEAIHLIKNKMICLSPENHPWNNHVEIIHFDDATDLKKKLQRMSPNTLLIPNAYNHKLADVMLYLGPGQLRVAKITIAETHIFRMQHILPYLQVFADTSSRCCELIFDVIIPYGNIDYYKISRTNFNFKHNLLPYDKKWVPDATARDLATVYWVDRSERPAEVSLEYKYPAEVTFVDCLQCRESLRKRRKIEDISSLEPGEDEEELEGVDNPDYNCEFGVYL